MKNSKKVKHIVAFNYLRLFAFSLVFISHMTFLCSNTIFFGACGVSIFIVLSGFLEYYNVHSGTVIKKLNKRFKSVFPIHIITFLISIPVSGVIPFVINGNYKSLLQCSLKVLANILMFHSFIPIKDYYFSFNSVSWYLSLVLLFAVTAPMLCKLVTKMTSKLCVGGGWICIIWLVQVVYSLMFSNSDMSHWLIYINPIYRLGDFIIGMLLANELESNKYKVKLHYIVIPFVVLILSMVIDESMVIWKGLFMQSIWIPISIFFVSYAYYKSLDIIEIPNSFVYKLGDMGLELFMIHQLIIRYVNVLIKDRSLLFRLIKVLICILFTIICAWCYKEFRERKLK